jgi:uncharacterized protein (TIGR02611 family)
VEGLRSWVHQLPSGALIWRGAIGLTGLVVTITGVILLALPGPGWLIIFAGLAIWATEFAWAKSLLKFVRHTVGKWTAWIQRQPRWLAILIGAIGLVPFAAAAVGAWSLAK